MKKNIFLLLIVLLLVIVPFYIQENAEFAGADSQAEEAIIEMNPNYTPWFESIYEPASGEIETLLFSLQAALGAAFIGYYIGYKKGKSGNTR
ncbi:energy-coupling factor ABC transporter substrate-binding protein [Vallitalea okinawensis]|uniref:energy-coupling factor ABC transporter substrate-binding protein n=1 Tax=Vallitalea okinawensis TaxID=2078660 RepID=UPI000CFE02B2|nr:energy-coupling factor ABC transporter substrate-binding protein [Vallitalea okinawensis]